ncbi:Long-chain-fatty-acid--CoA ligase [Planctomycetes bacterium Poly30]|uniref:Long-chain-fatty-acid--CoA ligase n=1 Tax=Saltatorellus ferox TaxID=2528018 RepID=A0A518EPD3_9BACT|nr:Long-chain-fatty-acid--CoA ligase [Planctomycetes bacterium Poly30]
MDKSDHGNDQKNVDFKEQRWHKHYDKGVPAAIDFEEVPLHGFMPRAVDLFGDRPALVFLNATFTYAELFDKVKRCANALRSLGVKEGSRVAIQLPNIPQTVIAFHGAAMAGAEVVMTNPLYTLREIEHQWSDAECDFAFVADFIWEETIEPNRSKLRPKTYIVAHIPDYLRFPLNLLAPFKLARQSPKRYAKVKTGDGVHEFKPLVEGASNAPISMDRGMDEIAVLQYTGGTTGLSKGAVLSHRNLSCNAQQIHAWFPDVDPGHEVNLICLPLFHVFGLSVGMNWSIWAGSKMVLVPNPRDIPALVKAITKHKVTLFPGVPALFNAINHFPGVESLDMTSVKSCFSGSAPIPRDVQEKFEKLTKSTIIEGFGMSETSPVTHVNPLKGLRKIGMVGVPMSNTLAKIVDAEDDTKELGVGEEGELLVQGPQVMRGYWKCDDINAEVLKGGWMHTGDLASMDEDGFFKIVGRKKDMINCSGLKVFPDEVDDVLMAHPAILEAATIGVPDESRGETVKSFIVLKEGQTLTPEEIEKYARENLAAYKIPRQIEFLEELPKSSVMKILRRELRDREIAKNAGGAT